MKEVIDSTQSEVTSLKSKSEAAARAVKLKTNEIALVRSDLQ